MGQELGADHAAKGQKHGDYKVRETHADGQPAIRDCVPDRTSVPNGEGMQ
jgi:hypothetical protein